MRIVRTKDKQIAEVCPYMLVFGPTIYYMPDFENAYRHLKCWHEVDRKERKKV